MFPKRTLVLIALACGLIWAAPASAGPGHHGGSRGDGGYRDGAGGDVPSRVASRIRRAERALERAEDKADDGDASGAASALGSARKNLASALKSAERRVAAGNETGPDAIGAVVDAQHDAIDSTVNLFDGADGALVDALAQTLKSSLDGRDEAIAAIAALPAGDQADYEYVLEQIDEDVGDELDAIDEALADDTLTDDAKAALGQAKTQLEATRTAARALIPADSGSGANTAADDTGECDHRGGREGGRRDGGQFGGPEEGPEV